MFRLFLLLVLAVASIRPAHAQEAAGLRAVYDARLVPPGRVDAPLAPAREVDAPRTRAAAPDSHWRMGAVVGAVVGGLVGFMFGHAMDNIINEGEWRVGENTIGGTVIGAAGGGLIGAGIGSLIRR